MLEYNDGYDAYNQLVAITHGWLGINSQGGTSLGTRVRVRAF